ncbi:hypothetical protein ES692_17820 [Psychroserpens burtonensis]|uniref:Lipoprotein n=1 Tax=Psychroserpens burtonensis TaxID=49278 RepID=A0A5C7B7I1_9FLAO|nr:hypothetical protein [Psychroserpens burtonensis]TXE13802.1 hypothetical protein ES692_17820 [Psychroserpens burtonensis]
MRLIKIFTILLLTFSCSNKKDIAEFEKVLGKENSETLTFLVNDFETDFLKKWYPTLNTEKAYKKFLADLESGKTDFLENISKESKEKFKQSDLRLEIYSYIDSVWVENEFLIKQRFEHKNSDGPVTYSIQTHSEFIPKHFDKDSLLLSQLNYRSLNYNGKYWKALDSIKERNDFIKEYYKFKIPMGFLHSETIANMVSNSELDFSDYFIKRIIVTDFVYK